MYEKYFARFLCTKEVYCRENKQDMHTHTDAHKHRVKVALQAVHAKGFYVHIYSISLRTLSLTSFLQTIAI